jgi:hypothetical protein
MWEKRWGHVSERPVGVLSYRLVCRLVVWAVILMEETLEN